MKLLAMIFMTFVPAFSLQTNAQDKWENADKAIVRLKPSAFSQLPKNITSYLKTRGCTVPQSFGATKPHNVIRGEFAKSGQSDWAVLCSRKRISAILVFWKGLTKSVSETASLSDRNFLQTISEEGEIGFSRAIGVVDRNYIIEHFREYNGPKPPPIRHQGINDAYVEKASTARYFYRGRWLELQGAD